MERPLLEVLYRSVGLKCDTGWLMAMTYVNNTFYSRRMLFVQMEINESHGGKMLGFYFIIYDESAFLLLLLLQPAHIFN